MNQFTHPNESKIKKSELFTTMVLYLLFGSMITITLKIQNTTPTEVDGQIVYWKHTFVQTGFMFIGQLMCGVYYYFRHKTFHDQEYQLVKAEKLPIQPLWTAIPAFLDMTGSFLVFYGLTLIQASIYLMIKGSVVVYSAVLTYLIFKRNQLYFQYLGIITVVIGVFLVGTTSYFREQELGSVQSENYGLGLMVIIIG